MHLGAFEASAAHVPWPLQLISVHGSLFGSFLPSLSSHAEIIIIAEMAATIIVLDQNLVVFEKSDLWQKLWCIKLSPVLFFMLKVTLCENGVEAPDGCFCSHTFCDEAIYQRLCKIQYVTVQP